MKQTNICGEFEVGCSVKSTFGNSWGKIGKITKIQVYDLSDIIAYDVYVDFGDGNPINVSEKYLTRIESPFYVFSEDGYKGGFNSYGEARKHQIENGYGDILIKIDGIFFKIKPQ